MRPRSRNTSKITATTQTTARIIAPIAAVRPGRERTQRNEKQDDRKYSYHVELFAQVSGRPPQGGAKLVNRKPAFTSHPYEEQSGKQTIEFVVYTGYLSSLLERVISGTGRILISDCQHLG